jgi:beta-barrel assembly-enhancing protease
MKRIFIELFVLLAIGGLLWVAFAFFVKLPEKPVLLSAVNEKAIGERYTNAILSISGFEKVNNLFVDAIIDTTIQRISQAQENPKYSYDIVLIDNEMINAFALPGGYIIITKGLVDFCDTADELIAVICHEVGHIENRHVVTRLVKDIGLDLLTSGDTFVVGEIAKAILSSGYNRKQEEEADEFACQLLSSLGLEPRTLASFFRRLKDKGLEGPLGQFEMVSSHPNFDSRIKSVLSFKVPHNFSPMSPWFCIDDLKQAIAN